MQSNPSIQLPNSGSSLINRVSDATAAASVLLMLALTALSVGGPRFLLDAIAGDGGGSTPSNDTQVGAVNGDFAKDGDLGGVFSGLQNLTDAIVSKIWIPAAIMLPLFIGYALWSLVFSSRSGDGARRAGVAIIALIGLASLGQIAA
ncbi:hypothetical protein GKE82_23765 [Conexibacter sp. W3-3-2]|uniref:hypothetical protein n=1 Tax=Conexibacter sp. W3-3-2 TaxID=2675227 RepID=UPI0012BA1FD6|nr:hypothetical protein [Conexibacter sp. W3-3-2]MTD47224.1 hypothetical protein [Conexibacter sp. W3-3-2]